MMIHRDYLELRGQSIHKIIVHDHFLMIPGEFGADCERIIGGISIGILFSLRSSDIPPRVNHYVKSALKSPKLCAARSDWPLSSKISVLICTGAPFVTLTNSSEFAFAYVHQSSIINRM